MIEIVDLSHHNPVTSLTAIAKSGVPAVMHKFSQGSSFKDPTYAARFADASDMLLWGRYHFGDGSDVNAQIDNFLDGWTPAEQMALDWEVAPKGTPQMKFWQAIAFIDGVMERTGICPALYAGALLKEQIASGNQSTTLVQCKLWLTEWGPVANLPKGFSSYWLWQYTMTGVCPGIKGQVDRDRFDGDLNALITGWAT